MHQASSDRFSNCSDLRELNEAKVANILSYLDGAVAVAAPFTPHCLAPPLPVSSGDPSLPLPLPLPDTVATQAPSELFRWAHAGSETAQATYFGIKSKIEGLKFENDALHGENEELRRRLEGWKGQEAARRDDLKAGLTKELTELRQALTAQQKKAAQQLTALTQAKDGLGQQVEALAGELRDERARREAERDQLETAHAAAVAKLKARWQAQERAAREKWKLAEAKRIKETTLQSLEPDIVLLLNRHKAEKARLREDFENELRERDEALAARDASVEELKSRLQRDSEAALQREQKAFQDRLAEELARVRRQLEEDQRSEKVKRQQMESFFEDQKSAMQREIERLGREVLELNATLTKERASFHEAVAEGVARVTGQSNNMLENLKEKLMLEFSCREKAAAEQNARHLHSKENELRKKFEIERDAAIVEVTQHLKAEQLRLLNTSRGTDDLLRERYGQLQNENERLRVELELMREQVKSALAAKKEKEKEMEDMREVCNLSEQHIKAIEARIRSQYDSKMSILDNAWRTKLNEFEAQHVNETSELQAQIDTLKRESQVERNRFEIEQNGMEQRHHAELNHINERVLVAMTRKDNTIHTQGEQILALQETIKERMENFRRLRITPQDVFEGHGKFVLNNDTSVLPASIALPQGIILDSAIPSIPALPRKWSHEEAFRQLREALRIDAPPRLVGSAIPVESYATKEPPPTVDEIPRGVGDALGPLQPSLRACRTLREIHSECASFMAWVGPQQNEERGADRKKGGYTWLVTKEGVERLCARARRALKGAREWDKIREVLGQASFQRRYFDGNEAERVIGDVTKFSACVADAKGFVNELAKLLDRLYLIAPAMEDALGRSRALDDLEETTSLDFSAQLGDLLEAMGDFEESVKQNNTSLLRNVEAITERVAHLKQRFSHLDENT